MNINYTHMNIIIVAACALNIFFSRVEDVVGIVGYRGCP